MFFSLNKIKIGLKRRRLANLTNTSYTKIGLKITTSDLGIKPKHAGCAPRRHCRSWRIF